jgi:hypothetical protein
VLGREHKVESCVVLQSVTLVLLHLLLKSVVLVSCILCTYDLVDKQRILKGAGRILLNLKNEVGAWKHLLFAH